MPGFEDEPALVLLVGELMPLPKMRLLFRRSAAKLSKPHLRYLRHLPSLFDGEKLSCVSTSLVVSGRLACDATGSVA